MDRNSVKFIMILMGLLWISNPTKESFKYRKVIYQNYGLFSTIKTSSNDIYIGFLSNWLLVSLNSFSKVLDWFHQFSPDSDYVTCLYGTWTKFNQIGYNIPYVGCVCLPSYHGRACHLPIKGFTRIWKDILFPIMEKIHDTFKFDKTLLNYYTIQECILGIPTEFLSPTIRHFGKSLKLDNLGNKWSLLEILVLLNVISFISYQIILWIRSIRLKHQMKKYMTVNWYDTISHRHYISLISFPFFHPSFLQFIDVMLRYYTLVPQVYTFFGSLVDFISFYVASTLSVSAGFLLYHKRNGRNWEYRELYGSNAIITAMHMLLMCQMKSWEHIHAYYLEEFVTHLLHCLSFEGNIDLGSHLGAMVGVVLYYNVFQYIRS
ncbi:hypothetical protein BC833DRAFT_578143 [Globomyces pollinis-pini]|nr:hypothetical protein BC833DRAFT_578143 [Globomyces pollinis-pini]